MLRRRVAMVACAIALAAVAVIGFAPGSIVHALRNGGPGTYWVLGAGVVGIVAFIARAWRGRPMHTAWWVACLALPQLAALASSIRSGRYIDRALDGMVGTIVQRIVAEGTAEMTLATTLADLFTVACGVTIAIGLGGALVSEEPRPSSKRVLVVGGVWIAASIVLLALAARSQELVLQCVVPFVVAAMVALAVVSRGRHELAHRVAIVAIIAVFLLVRAIALRARATAFGGISAEGISALDQARLLERFIAVRHAVGIAAIVHGVLGSATFFTAYGFPRRSMLPAAVVLVLVAGISARDRRAFLRRMENVKAAFDVGVPIPSTSAKSGWFVSGDRYVVTRAGVLTEVVTQREMQEEEVVEPANVEHFAPARTAKAVFADADLTCGALATALEPKTKRRQSFALGTLNGASAPRPFVGDLEPLVSDHELVGLGFDLAHHYPAIEAILREDTFVLQMGGPELTYALGVDPEEVARAVTARYSQPIPKRDTIQLTVHATDTVRRLATALTILTVAFPMEGDYQKRYFALRIE